ncbi:hypothetical protein EDC04DRAFT_3003076 [Pisolithus marmoratus]|nr:hypothetical protein EDC04DRAFT_3003076 [Pisolithus marmoratus]
MGASWQGAVVICMISKLLNAMLCWIIVGLLLQTADFGVGTMFSPLTNHIAGFAVVYGIFLSLGEVGPGSCLGVLVARTAPMAIREQFCGISAGTREGGSSVGIWAFGDSKTAKVSTGPFWSGSRLAILSALVTFFLVSSLSLATPFRQYLNENGFDPSDVDNMKNWHRPTIIHPFHISIKPSRGTRQQRLRPTPLVYVRPGLTHLLCYRAAGTPRLEAEIDRPQYMCSMARKGNGTVQRGKRKKSSAIATNRSRSRAEHRTVHVHTNQLATAWKGSTTHAAGEKHRDSGIQATYSVHNGLLIEYDLEIFSCIGPLRMRTLLETYSSYLLCSNCGYGAGNVEWVYHGGVFHLAMATHVTCCWIMPWLPESCWIAFVKALHGGLHSIPHGNCRCLEAISSRWASSGVTLCGTHEKRKAVEKESGTQ